ncbi:MAG: lipopolysaccharide biosynthesis protein [Actinobacteria bacterium]|nr:lipopolysaccharide biosynthesis protein [Actinomycetota bacterium]
MVNTAWSGASNIWAMVVAFASVPALLGGLGTAAFGSWVLLQTFSATNGWLSLADIGVVVTSTREIGASAARGDGARVQRLTSAAVAVCTSLGIGSATLLGTVGVVLIPVVFRVPSNLVADVRVSTVVVALQVVADLVINAVEGVLEGLHRVDRSRALDIARRTVVVGAAAVAALLTGSIVATAVASAVSCWAVTVVALWMLTRQVPGWSHRPNRHDMTGLVRQGRDVALLRPLGVIRRTMDRVIAGVVLGPSAVALVEIASQLQAGADAVLSSTSYAVVPASAWVGARDDPAGLAELAERGTRYSMLATLPLVVAISMLSAPLIEVWLGSSYLQAAPLTSVAVLAVGVLSMVAVGSQLLLGVGRTREILWAAIVSIATNLVLSVVLVHLIGLVGVFVGTLVSAVVEIPLLGPAVLRATGLDRRRFLSAVVAPVLPPVLAQVAVIAIVLRLGLGPFPTVLVGGVAGALVFVVVGMRSALSVEEVRRLRAEFRSPSG